MPADSSQRGKPCRERMRTRLRLGVTTPVPILAISLLAVIHPVRGGIQEDSGRADQPPASFPIIATIEIDRVDVFDLENPHERHKPYEWANSLHILTREEVIRR